MAPAANKEAPICPRRAKARTSKCTRAAKLGSLALAALFSLVTLTTTRTAHAEADAGEAGIATKTELPRLALAGYDWLLNKPLALAVHPDKLTTEKLDPLRPPTWIDHVGVAFIVRDWSESHRLAGEDAVVDRLRLSRSTRMAVTRVRIKDSAFSPYMQVGLGQWRVDTQVLPNLPSDTELAAQVGGGFEWRLFKRGWLAAELDQTVLYREHREPQNIPSAHLYGALLAFRAEF